MEDEIITLEILRSWEPCQEGYIRFVELLPNGNTLDKCINILIEDNHAEWAEWLFSKCESDERFEKYTLNGYKNSGHYNSGHYNSGDHNSGGWNSGDHNSAHCNSGHYNSGHYNSGHYNSGNHNSGNHNSGHYNSGEYNSGNRNSGGWNSGDRNSGYFNTSIPDIILVFNKPCSRKLWENSEKPNFIYLSVTEWIAEEQMSNEEKIENHKFYVCGGYLKRIDYKEAWGKAYKEARIEDKQLLFKLPNFDADVFFEITGINVAKDMKEYLKELNNGQR